MSKIHSSDSEKNWREVMSNSSDDDNSNSNESSDYPSLPPTPLSRKLESSKKDLASSSSSNKRKFTNITKSKNHPDPINASLKVQKKYVKSPHGNLSQKDVNRNSSLVEGNQKTLPEMYIPKDKLKPKTKSFKSVKKSIHNTISLHSESTYSPSESETSSSNSDYENYSSSSLHKRIKNEKFENLKKKNQIKKSFNNNNENKKSNIRFTKEEDLALISYFQKLCKNQIQMENLLQIEALKTRPYSSIYGRSQFLIKKWSELVR